MGKSIELNKNIISFSSLREMCVNVKYSCTLTLTVLFIACVILAEPDFHAIPFLLFSSSAACASCHISPGFLSICNSLFPLSVVI